MNVCMYVCMYVCMLAPKIKLIERDDFEGR